MKQVYSRIYSVTILILLLLCATHLSYAQCSGGQPGGETAYDTTIATPTGINTLQLKFPKFDPQNGMVTCVRLCVTITGVMDSVSIENNSASPQTADVYYIRTDQITGPGLSTPLSNSVNQHYGPYALGATNGSIGSGPDFVSIVRDTVLNAQQVCRQLTDSAAIAQFYGLDSVTYTYNITAFTNISCTGGNYNSSISTSAFVRFRFQYCTCPPEILPINVRQFSATKIAADKAELKWNGYDDPYTDYHYEAQVSRDGVNFSSIGTVAKSSSLNSSYRLTYRALHGETGMFYFRIKQVYEGGYSRYSNIKVVTLENSDFPGFTLYPNPSNGIVGIKFDKINTGRLNFQIYNSQGQLMVKKDIVVSGASYVELATLESGAYWVKMTDAKTGETCVNQLLIK